VSITELAECLEGLKVPDGYYCLNCERHESLCIVVEDSQWKVFLSERGVRYEETTFATESEACNYFLKRIRQLWQP